MTPRSVQTAVDEFLGMSEGGAQARAVTSLGALPLIVLTRGKDQSADWMASQAGFLQLSTNSRQLFAENSGHTIPLDQPEAVVAAILQMEYLHPNNLTARAATTWSLGYAYQLQGERAAARQAYTEVIAAGQSSGRSIYTTAATINLGQIQEADHQLFAAARTYEQVLELAGDPPDTIACEALLGLGRIAYQWNDLEAAQQYGLWKGFNASAFEPRTNRTSSLTEPVVSLADPVNP